MNRIITTFAGFLQQQHLVDILKKTAPEIVAETFPFNACLGLLPADNKAEFKSVHFIPYIKLLQAEVMRRSAAGKAPSDAEIVVSGES